MSRYVPSGLSSAAVFGILAALLVMLLMGTPATADAAGAPSAPSLYQPVTTHNSVTLKWVADEDPAVSGIRYVVERSEGLTYSRASGSTRTGGTYSDGAVAILFTNRGLDPDTYYSYRVYAVLGSEWSSSSGSVTARTDSAPDTYVAPEPTPEATPEATPESTPEATPEATPVVTEEATPVVTEETTPVVTEETTPVVTDEGAGEQTNTEPVQGETPADDDATDNAVDPAAETQVEDEKDTILNEQDGGLNEQDTAVTRTTTTDTAITLTWNAAVADADLGAVTGYRIWWGTSPTRVTVSNDVESLAGDTVEVNRSSATTRSQEFSGLSPYTTYYFWVAPLFGDEADAADRTAGRISSRMTVTTAHASNSPSRVRDLTATEESDGSVLLNWTAAEAATGCPVNGHLYTLRAVNSGTTRHSSAVSSLTTAEWTSINFEAGKRYTFGVQATCGTGNAIVGEAAFVALTKGPDANTPPTVSLYPLLASSEGVRLRWWTQEKPADENWTFMVERKKSGWDPVTETYGDWETISGTYGDSFEYRSATNPNGGGGWGTVFFDYAVQPDSWYKYRVTTVDQDNSAEGAVSASRLVRTPLETVEDAPGVPTNVTASWNVSSKTVYVSWQAPAYDRYHITGYEITRTGGPEGSRVFTPSNTRSHRDILKVELTPPDPPLPQETGTVLGPLYSPADTGVLEGLPYNYYVRAINNIGMSDKSAPAYVVTEASNIAPVLHEQPDPNSPVGSVTLAEVTNVTGGEATMTVEWTHGTAGERVCNTDYHIVLGVNGIFKRGVTSVATPNPFVTISGYWYVLTHDPIGPYTRSVTAEIGGTWSDAADVPEGEPDIAKLSVAVFCGHADNRDKVGEADATLA